MTSSPRRVALCGLLLWACLAAPAGQASAAEFDRSFPVGPTMTLDVRLFGGAVILRGWQRNVVRIRATHFATDAIDVRHAGPVLKVRARATVGRPHAIDLTIDVPSWMPLAIAGTYVDVSITGVNASVAAETVRGDVRLKGGAGSIRLKSIDGEIVLEDASGTASLTAVNNGIRVRRLEGDLVAATVNGGVRLEGVRSRSVEVGTTGGDISWTGDLAAGGRYQFATHGGDIDVGLGAAASASVSVRAFDGQFRSAYPIESLGAPSASARKRFAFVLGSGAAHVELETFRGTISLRQ